LVAGGNAGHAQFLDSSEIFNPSTGDWTKAASMQIARDHFTMTLLKDGRVLVTGGRSTEGEIGSVEIYNPDLDTWQLIDGMNMFRSFHTATLLSNGQVLIVGGYAYLPTTDRSQVDWEADTAEVFDPVTNTFYLVGKMHHSRKHHSATLLPSGKALIMSGMDDGATGKSKSSAEIFDPATGSFSLTGSPVNRDKFVGDIVLLQDGTVFIRSGREAELFDPVSGQSEPIALYDGSYGRNEHKSVLLANGDVLVTGGADWVVLSSVDIYSPETKSLKSGPSLIQTRVGHSVVVLTDGRVLVIGGIPEWRESPLSSVEIYYP